MRLKINTEGVSFLATKAAELRVDRETGVVRTDRESGRELWQLQVAALDESGGEVLSVSVAGQPANFAVGLPVAIDGLVAIPWSMGERSGVAYRAEGIRAVDASTSRQPAKASE
ncbi:MAG TPA: hypothetical protein VN133_05090 [Humibacter sp.]|nr:hypothetical protein [Humibacter sp.]